MTLRFCCHYEAHFTSVEIRTPKESEVHERFLYMETSIKHFATERPATNLKYDLKYNNYEPEDWGNDAISGI